jgi:hypothetical protein
MYQIQRRSAKVDELDVVSEAVERVQQAHHVRSDSVVAEKDVADSAYES